MDTAFHPAEATALTGHDRLARSVAAGASPKAAALHPEGHNAFWESARPWLVLLGATALTAIGTYVIAKDSIDHFSQGIGTWTDGLVVGVSVGLGALLDAAIVISGMRTHQEKGWWAWLARLMFILCLGVEMMTLAYFYKIIQPESIPASVSDLVENIHNLLYFFRAGLPPLIVAFLAVAVRNLVFTQADRKRQMKERTGGRLMSLEARLADPANDEDKAQMVREYETQLYLFEYASDATQPEKDANTALIAKFKDIWGVGKANAEAALRDEIAHIQAQFTAERTKLQQLFERSILFLAAQQRLPDEALALAPSLEDIDWERFFAARLADQEESEDAAVVMNRTDKVVPINPAKPAPSHRGFAKWVYDQAYALMRDRTQNEVVNLATLAEKTGFTTTQVGEALRAYRPTVERKLRGSETMADNIVYANPGFYLLTTPTTAQ